MLVAREDFRGEILMSLNTQNAILESRESSLESWASIVECWVLRVTNKKLPLSILYFVHTLWSLISLISNLFSKSQITNHRLTTWIKNVKVANVSLILWLMTCSVSCCVSSQSSLVICTAKYFVLPPLHILYILHDMCLVSNV